MLESKKPRTVKSTRSLHGWRFSLRKLARPCICHLEDHVLDRFCAGFNISLRIAFASFPSERKVPLVDFTSVVILSGALLPPDRIDIFARHSKHRREPYLLQHESYKTNRYSEQLRVCTIFYPLFLFILLCWQINPFRIMLVQAVFHRLLPAPICRKKECEAIRKDRRD